MGGRIVYLGICPSPPPATVFRWYVELQELRFHSPNKRFSLLDQVSVEFVEVFYGLNDLWPQI